MNRPVLLVVTLALVVGLAYAYDNPEDLPFGISWLSQPNRAEYTKTEKADRGRFLRALYEEADSSARETIRSEVLPRCYASWMSSAAREEIEQLHESGNHHECKKRVRELLDEQPDSTRENIESYWDFCEHLWYGEHPKHKHHLNHNHLHVGKRHVRHAHSTFQDFAAEHLSWLSDDERTELKKLHEENKEKARDRLFEILEASSGEKREKGINQLQAACRELIVEVLGASAATELKSLKESGATNDELKTKIQGMLDGVSDEQKKAKALEHKYSCEKVYSLVSHSGSRKRRAHHHDLESKFKNEWSWLTDAQKTEIRGLKDSGKNDEFLLGKVFEYFKDADDRDAAENGLQTSCGGAILTILGPEKAEELKTFMANGAKPEAYEQKVKELLSSAPKKTLTKNQESCKLVFTGASRRRRHETGEHHHHTLEEYLESHLSWLTDAQKEQLKQLKQDGKSKEEIQKKVLEFYEAASGDQKEKATAALQAGCRELFAHLLGPEKTEELKKLKESGATKDELRAKGDTFVNEIQDEKKKQDAQFYAVGCRKVFGVESKRKRHAHRANRHRRNHHGDHAEESQKEHEKHSLEDLFKNYLSWVPEDKQAELLKQKEEGVSREDLQKKVWEIYEGLEGSAKEAAQEKIQAGCRKLLVRILGQEKADQVKQFQESGTPPKEIRDKIQEWFATLTDEHAKHTAKEYSGVCSKVFGAE